MDGNIKLIINYFSLIQCVTAKYCDVAFLLLSSDIYQPNIKFTLGYCFNVIKLKTNNVSMFI